MERSKKWAIFYEGKIIPIGDETIQWIRKDPTKIWGWFDLELMLVWKNMFPLTEESMRLGYLPLKNATWVMTLKPWWKFVTNRPVVQVPPPTSSSSSVTSSNVLTSEKFLTEAEKEWVEPVITVMLYEGEFAQGEDDPICRSQDQWHYSHQSNTRGVGNSTSFNNSVS